MNNIAQDRCVDAVITDDRYVGANWKSSDPTLNDKLAAIALRIIPEVAYETENATTAIVNAQARDYSDPNTEQKMKYKSGEMYPFGVSFVIGGKYISDVYPICGYDCNNVSKNDIVSSLDSGKYNEMFFDDLITNVSLTSGSYWDADKVLTSFPVLSYLPLANKITIPTGKGALHIAGTWVYVYGTSYPAIVYLDINNNVVSADYVPTTSVATPLYSYISLIPPTAKYILLNAVSITVDYNFGTVTERVIEDNKGLFRFPFARKGYQTDGALRKFLFYAMMGIKFDTTMAVTGMADLNITGMIFMQGNRVRNFINQGFAVPMIDRVILHPDTYWIPEFSHKQTGTLIYALGNGQTKTLFPWMMEEVSNTSTDVDDGTQAMNSKFNFPVMFTRNMDDNKATISYRHMGYVSPFFKKADFTPTDPIDATVATGVIEQSHTTEKERMMTHYILGVDPAPWLIDAVHNANSLSECTDYAFMSPDNIVDRKDFTGVVRSLCNVSTWFIESDTRSVVRVVKPISGGAYDILDRKFLTGSEHAAPPSSEFIDSNVFKFDVTSKFVEEERVIPDDNGCISRMKSVDEIFGAIQDAYEYLPTTVFGKTRQQLLDAGLVLNRIFFNEFNQTPNAGVTVNRRAGADDDNVFQDWAYATDPEEGPKLMLPTLLLNLGMKSAPYSHMSWPEANEILSNYMLERYLHDPDAADVYNTILSTFNIMSELYHPIIDVNTPKVGTTFTAYKGDVFAQTVSFRLNHWSQEGMNNQYAEAYRHGQYITAYMEQFRNYALRTTDLDKTFIPFCEQQGLDKQDFAYRSADSRVMNESFSFNEGNHQLQGVMQRYGINTDLPLIDIDKPNRLYYSDKALPGAYYDAWRNIRVGQYKDINVNLGPIQALVEKQDRLFAIHSFGVTQIYQSSKSQTVDDSSRIIIGNVDFLSDFRELTTFGTQHPQSVVKTDNGFYYVDWRNKKIINVSLKVTAQGSQFYYAEDLLEGKTLNQFFTDLAVLFHPHTNLDTPLLNDLFAVGGHVSGICGGYNPLKKEVYFSFMAEHPQGTDTARTLVYSEARGVFTGYYDYIPSMYLRFKDKTLMYVMNTQGGVLSNVLHDLEAATTYKNFEISFYVNGLSEQENLSNLEKEFLVHQIFSSYNLLSADAQIDKMITWETEWQNGHEHMYTDFVGGIRYWKVPEFIEHLWRVPVCEQQNDDNGPQSTKHFYTFEPGSSLRGPWLKVTIRYGGTDKIFLKNIITSFLISNA